AAATVGNVQGNQLGQEGKASRLGDAVQIIVDTGPRAGDRRCFARAFEAAARVVHGTGQLEGQRLVKRVWRWPHYPISCSQVLRIRTSRRCTVRGTQPSLSAISSTVYPSIFNSAIERSSVSARTSKRCRIWSAISARKSGVGSRLRSSSMFVSSLGG